MCDSDQLDNLESVLCFLPYLALLHLTLNPEQFLFFSFRYAATTLCGINKLCVIQSQHCAHKSFLSGISYDH